MTQTHRPAALLTVLFLACVGAGLPPTPTPTRLMRDPVEGKWSVDVTPDEDARQNQARDFADTLTLKANSFESSFLAKHGFQPVMYDEDTRPGGVGGFKATQTSKTDQGTAKWSGFVSASEMTGNLIWTKKDGAVLNYTFKGSKS